MSLVTVNSLPSSGTVDPQNVYHWRQTHYTLPPYNALPTPIDHGYWVVPSPDMVDPGATVQAGWLLLTTSVNELPVGLLQTNKKTSSNYSGVISAVARYAASAALAMTLSGHVSAVSTNSHVDISTQTTKETEAAYISTTGLGKSYKLSHELAISAGSVSSVVGTSSGSTICIASRNITESKDLDLLIDATKEYKTATSYIDVSSANKTVLASNQDAIYIRQVSSDTKSSLDRDCYVSYKKDTVASLPTDIDIPTKHVTVSNETSVDLREETKKFYYSDYPEITISKQKHIYESIVEDVSIRSVKHEVWSNYVACLITNVTTNTQASGYVSATISDCEKYSYSLACEFVYKAAGFKSAITSPRPVIVGGDKVYAYSINRPYVDVFAMFSGLEVEDHNFALLKKIGTQTWKYLAVLDDHYKSIITKQSLNVRYHEIVEAAKNIDLTYTSLGEVERVIVYKDIDKTEQLLNTYIEYVNGFPWRMTTRYYEWGGIHYLNHIQYYEKGPNDEIIPTLFEKQVLWIPPTIVVDCDPSITIGDVVYISAGMARPARANIPSTAHAVGFASAKPTPTRVIVLQSGVFQSVLTNLIPGATYWVSEDIAGGITNIVVTTPGHCLKRVGYAIDNETFFIDVSERLVVRA